MAITAVTIDSGPVEADDRLENVPRERWRSLMIERRRFLATHLPYDCRNLLQFVEDAELMYEACGFKSTEAYIREGLGLDPVQVHWAIEGLRRMKPDEAIEYSRAIEIGKADAEDRANQSRQGQRTDLVDNDNDVINDVGRPTGTSRAAALRRLRKDRPDIHARVLAGELTPHAGMVEAGFRKKTVCKRLTACERILQKLPTLTRSELRRVCARAHELLGERTADK